MARLRTCCIVNHTIAERTVILSSIIGSVDEDSFVRECFTVGFVDRKRYPLVIDKKMMIVLLRVEV
jgi:hypothetical protein